MAQATRSIPPTRELIGLYLGDQDSYGYYSARIVFEVCRRIKPGSFETLRQRFYGTIPTEDIDPAGYETLEQGYEAWTHLRALRKAK